MPALLPHLLDDFVENTIKRHFYGRWVDISMEYTDYFFADFIRMSSNKGKMRARGGPELSHKLQVNNGNSFRFSEMYAEESADAVDMSKSVSVPWTKAVVSMAYDIHEKELQQGKEQIIDTIVMRAHAMHNDYFEGMEPAMWQFPSSPDQERLPYYGIPYWVVKDTSSDGGFLGGNPAGHPLGAGGLSSTTYPRWRNWAFGYNAVSRGDLVHKIRKACNKTHFRSPHKHPSLIDKTKKTPNAHYTTEHVLYETEKLAETRNDNLGNDVVRYSDNVLIAGAPVIDVPYLSENDSSNPVYSLKWSELKHFYQKGKSIDVQKPITPSNQPTVRRVYAWVWQNMYCFNRRGQSVGAMVS